MVGPLQGKILVVDVAYPGQRHAAGRCLAHGSTWTILEDYYGLLGALGGNLGTTALWGNVPHAVRGGFPAGATLECYTLGDVVGGHRLDLIPEANFGMLDGQFKLGYVGVVGAHDLKFGPSGATLDGNALSSVELARILADVASGDCVVLPANHDGDFMEKAEDDLDIGGALGHIKRAIASGHLDPKVEQAVRRHVYEDRMTPGMGNKFAYEEFRAKQKPGVYVSMDGNSFGKINKLHGHAAGDEAIKAFGKHAREALDEAVGRHQAKLFRNPDEQQLYRSGGDEFVAHVPSHEHAAKFAKLLQRKLEKHPAIRGTHKLSMSFGFGHNPETADQALLEAKKQKYGPTGELKHQPGQEPSFAHSLVPGKEGKVLLSLPGTMKPQRQSQLPMATPAPVSAPRAPKL